VLTWLNLLEALGAPLDPADPMHWHRWIETGKLAWRDRLRYLGDGAAVERLLTKAWAAGRVESLRQHPEAIDRRPAPSAGESPGTVNLTAGDSEGNLVAMTISHGGSFGSCVTVPGTGITLGHGMCRFDPRPGRPNSAGAGKRPLNNVCPTILRLPDRQVAIGHRGGRRIVSVVTQMCQAIVDTGATGLQAVTQPRMHVEEQEPASIQNAPAGVLDALRAMGHDVKPAAVGGHANAVELLKDGRVRAASNVWAAGLT
jgi:gamma-glutamyltranspeptidase/glutathione hydrolase